MVINIKIESLDKVFSSNAGLVIFNRLLERLKVRSLIDIRLPTLESGTLRSQRKFLDLMLGFQAGADCLDDMDRLALDEGFAAVCGGKTYTAKAYGDFLRSFSAHHCKELNLGLIDLAFALRSEIKANKDQITFDFDSTSNEQHGLKIEGAAERYDGLWCLDTIQCYDENGIQYWHDVRPGNTSSSKGVAEIIHSILNRVPKNRLYKNIRKYARADSAFCNVGFFNACAAKNLGFVVCMRENMSSPLLHQVRNWKKTNPSREARIKFYDKRDCEIGETFYRPEGGAEILRVLFIRALKKGHEPVLFKQDSDYDYYAWVSNIGEHEMSSEKLIKFYRKRGQMENYIKEAKYGFDLKHYPCLKLTANKAYGLIAAFAYNLMRFVSLKDSPENPQYAKALRHRFIHLPAQVVRHGRQVTFRFMNDHYLEVKRWFEIISHAQFGYS